MKKCLLIALFILSALNLNAFILPEGSDARIKSVEKNEDGIIVSATFSHPSEINTPIGKILATGTVYFNTEGKVIQFQPANDGSIETPVGTINYRYSSDGDYHYLYFYDSGALKHAYLNPSEIKYKDAVYPSEYDAYFYDNWIPESLMLCSNITVTNSCGTFTCNNDCDFYPTGKIKSFYMEKQIGIPTKYGIAYPNIRYPISFYQDGSLKQLVSEDVMEISAGGRKLTTIENTTLHFSHNGVVNMATVYGGKINFYGWDITSLHNDQYNIIVYPKSRIFIESAVYNLVINGTEDPSYVSIEWKDKIPKYLLIDKENCYSWDKDSSNTVTIFNKATNEMTTKTMPNSISYFSDAEIDFVNPPLDFDEDNNLTGFGKSYSGYNYDYGK